KLVVHANILDAVMHDQGIIRVPAWLGWIITFAVTAFVIGWVMSSTPLTGVFATIGLALALLLLSQALYSYYDLWIRVSQPIVGVFLGYYLIVPYRLIREYKKRSDYQQRNLVLTQVEELKRNFLSLVTHDLKTPVARIQGLAEVLLRKSSDRLVEKDLQTLNHIINSTDELNRFISSILELSKLESNRLTLNLESKDINQLIERAVDGFKAQARSKKVSIETALEPLFPIRMDASLISKVLNNLIDNAIKYSPDGSTVKVESHEKSDFIVISVRDQGIGISEEDLSRLFTRFFRAKNDTTEQIHGTGLGLYLTKYFVEAHGGRVEVESEQGLGSIFRIYLSIIESEKTNTANQPQSAQHGLTSVAHGIRAGGKKLLKPFSVNKEKKHV
ncbi:MAG: ATP-binding protein, partial [Bdellovibrionota bacterium]